MMRRERIGTVEDFGQKRTPARGQIALIWELNSLSAVVMFVEPDSMHS